MDNFLKEAFKALLPIVFIFSFLYVSGHLSSDYYFHISYQGDGDYPPLLSWLLSPFGEMRNIALFAINILATTAIPYILIYKITKSHDAGWVYLYSGISLVLFVIWLVPQAIIQCLMLLSILNPIWFLALMLFGWKIHQFWWAGALLVGIYKYFRWKEWLS